MRNEKNQVKEIWKKCKYQWIGTILTFLIGLFFLRLSKGNPINTRIWMIIAGFFPFLVFLPVSIFCLFKKEPPKKRVFLEIKVTLIISTIVSYYASVILVCALEVTEHPITDPKYYQDKVKGKRLHKVFPKKIPEQVEELTFFYSPGALQAGTSISLYYIDQAMTEEKFKNTYQEKAIWIGYKKDYQENEGLLAGVFSHTPIEMKNENNYLIYLIEGRCDDSGYCNHGDFLIAAYNKKTKEVLFQSEDW